MAAALALAPVGRAWSSPPDAQPIAVELHAAVQAYDANQDCTSAEPAIAQAVASPDFSSVGPQAQSDAFRVQASCAENRDDHKAAYAALVKAAAFDESPDWIFVDLLVAADRLHQPEDAVAALELTARKKPSALPDIPLRRIMWIEGELEQRRGEPALLKRWRETLDRADYRPSEPFKNTGELWLRLARQYADAGDLESARRMLGRIKDTSRLAYALVDRRFFAVTDADPQRFDMRRVAEQRLADDRDAMARNPKLLEGSVLVAGDLRTLGRPEEALAVLDAALPGLHTHGAFTDVSTQENWYWDARSHAFRALGRLDDAVAALKKGAAAPERDGDNISQTVNLASLLFLTGHSQAALDIVSRVPNASASTYGQMEVAQLRVCALSQLGRHTEAAADRTFLSTHEADDWSAAVGAALCDADLDGAAAILIRALADPSHRGQALVLLSEFDHTAFRTPPMAALKTRLAALAKRPDMQAAIAKAGRVMRFHVVGTILD